MDKDTEYYDLGSYSRHISTSNAEASKWFNRGLIWSYAFNHEEAAKCFERAIEADGRCCMAYWGLAYTLGPNYNKPWEAFADAELETTTRRINRVFERAKSLNETLIASPLEKALFEAVELRYPGNSADSEPSRGNQSYADAMGKVYEQFDDDLDVAALYADALMNLSPWQLWYLETGAPASGSPTLRVRAVLERAMSLEGGSHHPGLLHLYIHLMEMSPTPEAALEAANTLRDLVPHASHLNHMPSHIDVILGDYQAAIDSNQNAILADDVFFGREEPFKFYTLYRAHNYHFRIYAAMFAAQSAVALDTASQLEAALSEDLLRTESLPMADWLEGFVAMRVHALIRFGRWQEIIDLELPHDAELYSVTTTMTHYAKGVAFAATGEIEKAEQQRELFKKTYAVVPHSRTVFNNTCVKILEVAEAMLNGEIEYRRGRHENAFAHLREANTLYVKLPYDEPWGWMQPPCHALGALLAEQGRYEEALALFEEDLGMAGTLPRSLQHPKNVWALYGCHECLVKLGREEKAKTVKVLLDEAVQRADVPIRASCFCRLQTA